jgi:hypothetical protein
VALSSRIHPAPGREPPYDGGPKNQFHAIGLMDFEDDFNFDAAIMGGTGTYANARGDLHGRAGRPDNLTWEVRINLS